MYQQPDITPMQVGYDLINTLLVGLEIGAFLFVAIWLPYYLYRKTQRRK